MTARAALTLAALLMFVAVAAGAFGAHALRARLGPDMSSVWQTAVQYHAWHALGLAVVGLLTIHVPERAGLAHPLFPVERGDVRLHLLELRRRRGQKTGERGGHRWLLPTLCITPAATGSSVVRYSTVTDLARLRGWSTSVPLKSAT